MKHLSEGFIKNNMTDMVEMYYSTSPSEVLQIIQTSFKDKPVRILYDLKKQVYLFGDANKLIHLDLIEKVKQSIKSDLSYYYLTSEEEIYHYMDNNCALFKIIHKDDIKSFTRYDGYRYSYIGKLADDLYAILRNTDLQPSWVKAPNEYSKCQKVPLLKDVKFIKYDIRGNLDPENTPQDMANNETPITESLSRLRASQERQLRDTILRRCFRDGELDSIIPEGTLAYDIEDLDRNLQQELFKEYGTTDSYELSQHVSEDFDEGVAKKVYETLLTKMFEETFMTLLNEFKTTRLIYRKLSLDTDITSLINVLEKDGTGNCWAKNEDIAEAYYGYDAKYEYTLVGLANLNNIDFEETIYLRMVADYENEVRLKANSPIRVLQIKTVEYDGSTIKGETTTPYNRVLTVGSKFIY